MKVIAVYSKRVVFEAETEKECKDFILSLAEPLADGRIIFREIHEPDGIVYDIGNLFKVVAEQTE